MSSRRKRRSKYEIIFAILRECHEPILKTRILERTNLSPRLLNEYLNFLEERGLIVKKRIEKKEHWTITEKGKKWLKIFEQIQKTIGILKC